MLTQHFRKILARCVFPVLLLSGAVSCGGEQQEAPMPDAEPQQSSSVPPEAPAERGAMDADVPAPTDPDTSPPTPSAPSSSRGTVLAGRELGMIVTGTGVGVPGRSPDVLEGQIWSFLPQLQEAYDLEREHDPGLMGSLEINLVIEPGGTVSDVRFPRTRVSSEKLVNSVFDRIRTWTFPPADEKVQLRYTLLFIPPGVDQASIFMWEKHLGNRLVADRSGEEHTTMAMAPPAEPIEKPTEPVEQPAPKAVTPRPAKPAKRPTPSAPTRAETTRRPSDSVVTGWYRVTRTSALHAAPRDASDILTQLRPGTRIRVVDVVNGEWLEVRSVRNRAPGYLRRANARPDAETTRAREGSRF